MAFDLPAYLMGKKAGSGSSVEVEPLSVTDNGTYTAPTGKAYSPVSVDVEPDLTTKTITANGTYNASDDDADGYSKVTVNVSTIAPNKGAVIRDYDGSVIATYTKSEFAALSAYPTQPTHSGLTGQGYNWTLADAKTYVATYDYLEIGAQYITDDGKTRLYITLEDGRLSPTLTIGLNGTAVIDWGDGSSDTVTGSDTTVRTDKKHVYQTSGDYVITLDVTGNFAFLGNSTIAYMLSKDGLISNDSIVYSVALRKLKIGRNITTISSYAFKGYAALSLIVIPDSVTSIGSSAFNGCAALSSIIIPDSVTSIGSYAFNDCRSLSSIIIPDSVTSIDSSAFTSCYALSSITTPDSVTSIGSSAFQNCYGLGFIKFEASTPATVSDANAWAGVPTDCIIYVPTGSLSAYTSANNYPDPNTYTYTEYTA